MLCTSKEVAVAVVDNAVYVEGRRTAEPDTLDHTFEVLKDCAGGGPSFCWIGMLPPTGVRDHRAACGRAGPHCGPQAHGGTAGAAPARAQRGALRDHGPGGG